MSPFCPFRGGVAERGQCPPFLPFFFIAGLPLVAELAHNPKLKVSKVASGYGEFMIPLSWVRLSLKMGGYMQGLTGRVFQLRVGSGSGIGKNYRVGSGLGSGSGIGIIY